eukprot:TRINITY_DN138_c0_g1_i6.p1 TRINITY_DN138_c0_g1~~TRINITY_DN138_c0_g1_i6.p1  ORF type:complete len:138 (+),score=50.33 TRINITY_DN138_c0_g1_i6:50-415(+)
MIRRPPRSTHCISSAASDVYKRQETYKHSFKPIDYSRMVKSISNFLFVPLYGYCTELVGVLKLFNRKDRLPSLAEVSELEPYQKAIGLMIRQIEELKSTMSTASTIKKMLRCIEKAEINVT